MFSALGPLIRLGTSSRTLSRTSALCHRPFPKSQAPSSHRAPVLPVPLSTLAPSIVCTRSLIGTNEGLTTYLQNNLQNNYKVSFNKASENTIFFVTLLVESSGNKILMQFPDVHLDIAT